jgi:hypothetical protein
VSNIYSSLPPMFRPRTGENLSHPDTTSKPACSAWSWVRYGNVVLCLSCALARSSIRGEDYASPWPDAVPGLGSRTVGAFARCEAER